MCLCGAKMRRLRKISSILLLVLYTTFFVSTNLCVHSQAVAYQTECRKDAFYQEMDEFLARGSILAYGKLNDGWSLVKFPNGMYNYRNEQGELLAKRADLPPLRSPDAHKKRDRHKRPASVCSPYRNRTCI